MEPPENDRDFMGAALDLARRGQGRVEPNPMVGAVLVKGGRVIASGYHEAFGGLHAEANALQQAGKRSRDATLYVTLEPCCHHGKTPPCTDAILKAGVRRVVTAMLDPFERVSGRGVEILRNAGVEVAVGCLEEAARELNAPYIKLRTCGLPYLVAKWAMTLDGKTATETGDSRWISSEASRRIAHNLRGRVDAIVVGIGTVLADDPELTARPPGPRTAVRVVLDSKARTPTDSRLVKTIPHAPLVVAATESAPAKRVRALRAAGAEVLVVDADEAGRTAARGLAEVLGQRNMTNVLIEGGQTVTASFFQAGLVDEVHCFIAPKVVGGSEAPSPVAGAGVREIAQAIGLAVVSFERVDCDLYVRARTKANAPQARASGSP